MRTGQRRSGWILFALGGLLAIGIAGCASRSARDPARAEPIRVEPAAPEPETEFGQLEAHAERAPHPPPEFDDPTALPVLEASLTIPAGAEPAQPLALEPAAPDSAPFETIYALDDFRFAPGSAELSSESRAILDQLIERLSLELSPYRIEVHGHTDATGNEAGNLQLGQRRADAIRRYLHDAGDIPLHLTATVSHADRQPAGDNQTAQGRAQNRRAVVLILRRANVN